MTDSLIGIIFLSDLCRNGFIAIMLCRRLEEEHMDLFEYKERTDMAEQESPLAFASSNDFGRKIWTGAYYR